MTPEQITILSRIDERTKNLEKVMDTHIEDDRERFERTFSYIKERHDATDTKLDTLWDKKNKNEGAIGMGKWMAGALGGVIVAAIDYMTYRNK